MPNLPKLLPLPRSRTMLLVMAFCCTSAAFALAFAATGAPGRSVRRSADPTTPVCTDGGWCWVEPLPQGNQLHGLWVAPSGEAWAVGNHTTILRRSSGRWSAVPAPEAGDLEGVWGAAPDDVWAVGAAILHWDGTAWRTALAPDRRYRLRAVSGSGPRNVWVASAGGTTYHWNGDGGAWTEHAVPWSSKLPPHLAAIWTRAPDDTWTASSHGDVFHWDGKAWALHASGVAREAQGLWGAGPRDIWIAGMDLLRGDGARWTPLPAPDGFQQVTGLWGRRADDIWAAELRGLLHWDGRTWSRVAAFALTFGDRPRLVAGGPGDEVWIVTWSGNIVRWSGSSGSHVLAVEHPIARGPVWGFGAGDVWIAGADRSFAHWDGRRWTVVDGPEVKPWALWGARPDDIWAVGAFRGAAHWNGKRWIQVTLPIQAVTFHAVWGSGAHDVWAVGDGGSIIHWDGRTWSKHAGPTPRTLVGIWAASPSDAWAVADDGTILRWDGARWTASRTPLADDLGAIWGSGPRDVWAVGNKYGGRGNTGTILHWDGSTWSERSGGAASYGARTIFGTDARNVWIVGLNLLHWDGTRWTEQPSAAGLPMEHVWSAGDGTLWASGSNGVLRRGPPPRASN